MMDQLTIEAAEQAVHAGFPTDAGAALVIELDGSEAECESRFDHVVAICESNGATGIRIAQDDAERAAIWQTRKAAFAAMGRIAPNYYVQDGVIPRTKLPRCWRASPSSPTSTACASATCSTPATATSIRSCSTTARARPSGPRSSPGRSSRPASTRAARSPGEHGVGFDKKRYMPSMFYEPDLDAFQRLRCAFDPAGLANPGKVMPTPRLCGEVPGPYRQHPLERDGVAERF